MEKLVKQYLKNSKIHSFTLVTNQRYYKVRSINGIECAFMPKYVHNYFSFSVREERVKSKLFELGINKEDALKLNEDFIKLLKPIEKLNTCQVIFKDNKLSFKFRLAWVIKETLISKEEHSS